jgi:hypothetical protein
MTAAAPTADALLDRVRDVLAREPQVEEKYAFGGRMFMIRGKLCLSVRDGGMMFRVDPERHDALLPRRGCSTMVMKGRSYRGYVRVAGDALRRTKEFDFWMRLALEYNRAVGEKTRPRSSRPR